MTETRKVFHDEIVELDESIRHLADLVIEAIRKGSDGFIAGDVKDMERAEVLEKRINALTNATELHAYEIVARQAPMASDLRNIVSVMKVVHDLERIGDLIMNVVKATQRMYPDVVEPEVVSLVEAMRDQAISQTDVATQAFVERDPDKAMTLVGMDDVMDELQHELFRHIFAAHGEEAVKRGVQVALVGRYFERMADHAVNIADRVPFMVTGKFAEDPALDTAPE